MLTELITQRISHSLYGCSCRRSRSCTTRPLSPAGAHPHGEGKVGSGVGGSDGRVPWGKLHLVVGSVALVRAHSPPPVAITSRSRPLVPSPCHLPIVRGPRGKMCLSAATSHWLPLRLNMVTRRCAPTIEVEVDVGATGRACVGLLT